MPKFLILKHYNTVAPTAPGYPPLPEWEPAEITAHIAFMRHVGDVLRETGEFVDAQALAPTGSWVRYGGPDAAPVTDGPFAEAKELIAGWYAVDVEDEARAHEIAAWVSSAPGPRGEPIFEWLEVRPFMDDAPEPE